MIRQQPLREGGWRLLALSLWACDRQADALAALRRARRILRDELGLEPGPALAEVEEAILGQHQEVLRRAQARPAGQADEPTAGRTSQADEPTAGRTSQGDEPARAADDPTSGPAPLRKTRRRRASGSIRRCSPGCDTPQPPGRWP